MRYKQYLDEKALISGVKLFNDVLHILDIARENLSKFKNIDQFFEFVNAMIKEDTKKPIKFEKIKNNTSSAISGQIIFPNEITVFVPDGFFKYFDNDKVWRTFTNGVIGTLKHEITHGKQFLKVKDAYWDNKSNPISVTDFNDKDQMRKYYSHKHEVMAHAQNIIIDIVNRFGTDKKDILQYLKRYKPGVSDDLDAYFKLFKKNDKTIKLLYRYMYDIVQNDKDYI